MAWHARPLRADRGSATAEVAVVTPVLVLLLVMGVWVVGAAAAMLRCGDAARTGARALARGDTAPAARAEALRSAPAGATWQVVHDSGTVQVTVTASVQPFSSWAGFLPAIPVQASVTAAEEA